MGIMKLERFIGSRRKSFVDAEGKLDELQIEPGEAVADARRNGFIIELVCFGDPFGICACHSILPPQDQLSCR